MMSPPALAPNAAPPVLDSRAMQNPQMPPAQMRPTQAFNQYAQKMRQMNPDPNKQRLAYQIGSVLGPALFGKVAGGSGKQAALYGVGSAAYNYQDQLDRFKKTEQEIAAAEFSLPSQEQAYDLNEAKTWRAYNAAVAGTGAPASVREYEYFKNLSPAEQEQWMRNKRAGNRWVDANGNVIESWSPGNQNVYGLGKDAPGAVAERAYAAESATQAAQTSPGAIAGQTERAASIEGGKAEAVDMAAGLNAAQSVVSSSQQGLDLMYRMLASIEAGPDTNAASDWVALVDADLQQLRGLFNEQTLTSLTQAKAAGATFGGMSEGEWKFLGQLGAQLGNKKSANLALIKNKISILEQAEARGRESWNRIQTKGIRSLPPERRRPVRPGDKYLGDQ